MKKILMFIILSISIFAFNFIQVSASENEILGANVIHKQANQILTINDIKAMYNSTFGQITVENDTYTGYGNVVGLKTVDMVVETFQETYRKTISIYVVNLLGNVKAVTDYKDIHLRTDQVLTPTQIVYVLENTGYLEITATTQMSIENDTYTINATTPGTYVFEFRLINSAGLDEIYSSKIYVSDGSSLFVPDVIFEAPVSPISSVLKWILNFILFCGSLFVAFKIFEYVRNKSRKGWHR